MFILLNFAHVNVDGGLQGRLRSGPGSAEVGLSRSMRRIPVNTGKGGGGRGRQGGVKIEKSIMGAPNLQGLETTFLTPEVFSKGPPKAQCPSNSPNTPSEYSCQGIVGTGWPLSGSVSSPRGRWAGVGHRREGAGGRGPC